MIKTAFYYKTIASPVGPLKLIASDKGLCAVLFHDGRDYKLQVSGTLEASGNHPMLVQAEKQLAEYFSGARTGFDVALDMRGTVFQQKAWRELQNIPFAQTISYGEQAKCVGDAKKARAVGMANGRNPLAIVVPCHRVIGATGALTGFGGGLKTKKALLDLEKKFAA